MACSDYEVCGCSERDVFVQCDWMAYKKKTVEIISVSLSLMIRMLLYVLWSLFFSLWIGMFQCPS